MNKALLFFQNRGPFFSELVPLSALRRTTIATLGLLSCTDSLIQQTVVMMHKLSPFVLFCSLCSIANTKLTPESPTRWEGSRISIAKSNSSFLVSTFPGVEEKTGNFSCSLFGGSQSGDVDLICAVSGSPEVRVHVMKARAGM